MIWIWKNYIDAEHIGFKKKIWILRRRNYFWITSLDLSTRHGPMKIVWFQHGGHSVLRKLNIWSKCHCSIQVRKFLHMKIENSNMLYISYLYISTGHCKFRFTVILKVGVKCKQLTFFRARFNMMFSMHKTLGYFVLFMKYQWHANVIDWKPLHIFWIC